MNAEKDIREKEARLKQLKQEQLRLQQQIELSKFVTPYPINLQWPSKLTTSQTDFDLIQYRLLENGVVYDAPSTVGSALESTAAFISDMERTGCFNSVKVEIEQGEDESKQRLHVKLDEKRWYRLHIGGGVKAFEADASSSPDSFMPPAEIDFSLGLRNLSGFLDQTSINYSLDTRNIGSWSLKNEVPLYILLPETIKYSLLGLDIGSQYTLTSKAVLNTVDYEYTRGYQEYQRLVSFQIANTHSVISPEAFPGVYYGFGWATLFRDIAPRRRADSPWGFHAAPDVLAQSGPSVKHSVTSEFRLNGALTDHPLVPSEGIDFHSRFELATPPGDVGFWKLQSGFSIQEKVSPLISIHGIFQTGILKSLSYGGICRPAGLSDRFYAGGPLLFRGFSPAGVGPRAGKSASDPGDAIGGDFFYTATAMASVAAPKTTPLVGEALDELGFRFFGFVSAGTCVGSVWHTTPIAVLASTRLSAGVGVATAALGPRLETTFSWPLRYGTADIRRQWQFGIGFTIG